MSKLLGLIDALESLILEGTRVPLSGKIMIHEGKVAQLLDKIRLTAKNQDAVMHSLEPQREPQVQEKPRQPVERPKESKFLADEKIAAEKIRQGANEYAEYILSNLQLTMAKVQRQIHKIEQNIESGRDILEHKKDTGEATVSEKTQQPATTSN